MVDATGQCVLVGGACPTGCRAVTSAATGTTASCWPQVPLQGKPGKMAGCQPGLASEPFGDAWDCMDPDIQTAITRMLVNFGKAIAAYEGTLILGPSPFDQWAADLQAGHGDSSTAISGPAKIGAQLFVGKAGCSDCHNTPLFSDSKFHNVGIGQIGAGVPTLDDCPAGGVCDCAPVSDDHPNGPKNCLPFGATDGLQKLQANGFLRNSPWSDDKSYDAPGGMPPDYLTPDPSSRPIGGYRTPSLRNVSQTAPYMHDGSIATLADVVWHYNQGISDETAPGAPVASFKPLYLSDDEQAALVAFLESLASAPPPAAVTAMPMLP
jgi:cytochrome c peroxidase